jgi:hypothetical protein
MFELTTAIGILFCGIIIGYLILYDKYERKVLCDNTNCLYNEIGYCYKKRISLSLEKFELTNNDTTKKSKHFVACESFKYRG